MPRDLEKLLKNTAKKAIALAQDDALNAGEDPPTTVTFFMPPTLRPFVNLSAARSNGSKSKQAKSGPPPSSASNKTATSSGSTSNQDTATPNVANLSK